MTWLVKGVVQGELGQDLRPRVPPMDARAGGTHGRPERDGRGLRGIKRFPGIVANDGVTFEVAPGGPRALGENGAGKTT